MRAGAAARVAAAIVTDVVGAAVVTGDTHRLANNVATVRIGALAKVNALASPATVGNAWGRALFAFGWKRLTEDVAITLAGGDWLAAATSVAEAVGRTDFLIAVRTFELKWWAVGGDAVAVANCEVRFAIAIAWRRQANVGRVARLVRTAVLVAVAAFTLRTFAVTRDKVARYALGFGESIGVRRRPAAGVLMNRNAGIAS